MQMENAVFEAELEGLSSSHPTWTTRCAHTPDITMAVPPEFLGPGGGASPEDLFVMSLLNCFGATFQVMAKNSKLEFEELRVKGRIRPGRNSAGQWVIKTLEMEARLVRPSDAERARRLMEKASGACLILNSTTLEKTFCYDILG